MLSLAHRRNTSSIVSWKLHAGVIRVTVAFVSCKLHADRGRGRGEGKSDTYSYDLQITHFGDAFHIARIYVGWVCSWTLSLSSLTRVVNATQFATPYDKIFLYLGSVIHTMNVQKYWFTCASCRKQFLRRNPIQFEGLYSY